MYGDTIACIRLLLLVSILPHCDVFSLCLSYLNEKLKAGYVLFRVCLARRRKSRDRQTEAVAVGAQKCVLRQRWLFPPEF